MNGQIGRTETNAEILFEEPVHEVDDGAFQIGESDALVHHQSLHLVEHRAVAGIEVVLAIHPARTNDPDRWRPRFHGSDLHRRRMGTQQHAVVEVERVVHCPRRMVRRDVERFEVVVLVLDLGTRHDVVAGGLENAFNCAGRSWLWDAGFPRAVFARAKVTSDRFFGKFALELPRHQSRPALLDGLLDAGLGRIDARSRRRAFGWHPCRRAT